MISLLKRAISRLKRAIPLFLKKLFKKHTFIVIFTFSEIRRSQVYGSVRFFFFLIWLRWVSCGMEDLPLWLLDSLIVARVSVAVA